MFATRVARTRGCQDSPGACRPRRAARECHCSEDDGKDKEHDGRAELGLLGYYDALDLFDAFADSLHTHMNFGKAARPGN